MNTQDLKTLAEIGRALWADPRESQLATVETLSAVMLLDLTPERALERAASVLLDRVTRKGAAADTRASLSAEAEGAFLQPFFRLYPEERFVLVALHLGRWSYARLSRVLEAPVEGIEEMAWASRLSLVASQPGTVYPAGAPSRGANCPAYEPKRPWTQRFLDEEVTSGRERIFLQNHLMACESCREALSRCRSVYYAIERSLPRLSGEATEGGVLESLERIARRSLGIKAPFERSFVETLRIFSRRRDVRWVLGALGAWVAWRCFKS